MTSIADFVLFVDINSDEVHLLDLPLLKETIDYQYTKATGKIIHQQENKFSQLVYL